jgi:hypothetical protein
MSAMLKRVKINGEWYDATVGTFGGFDLYKFGSPAKFTVQEPYAHVSNLFWVYDANKNKVGEFDIQNKTCSGYVDDVEALNTSRAAYEESGDIAPVGRVEKDHNGCLVYLGFILSNWGGRIGVILGILFTIVVVKTENNMPVENLFFTGIVVILVFGTIGAVIGWIIKLIKKRFG